MVYVGGSIGVSLSPLCEQNYFLDKEEDHVFSIVFGISSCRNCSDHRTDQMAYT